MSKKKVAVVQPLVVPGGGTEAVTAWTIETLKTQYDVTLVTFSRVDPADLNQYYGTELSEDEFSIIRPRLPPLLNRTKKLLVLKDHFMMRYCKSVAERFNLFISIGGVMDFGSPGIQYMALAPGSTLVKVLDRDPQIPSWYQMVKRLFMRFAESISAFSEKRLQQNTTLATSRWAGQLTQRLYGFPSFEVVYPPVGVTPSESDWDSRENGFLCIARISPEKQIERAIEIIRRVRQKGFKVSLRIIGRQDNPQYLERINHLCDENADWVTLHGAMTRNELGELMGQIKYGINAAADEPFGIALAEMVSSGCIVFVPNSGGQTEIVEDPRLTYENDDDAVNKITSVLNNDVLRESLRHGLAGRDKDFSTEAFCGSMRRVVGQFFARQ